MTIDAKICGITDPIAMEAAVRYGASMVGLVFFPPSPRALSPEEAAMLLRPVPGHVTSVGLFVDPDDSLIDRVLAQVPLEVIQLHGNEPAPACTRRSVTACYSMRSRRKMRRALAAMRKYSIGPCWKGIAGPCRGCWPVA